MQETSLDGAGEVFFWLESCMHPSVFMDDISKENIMICTIAIGVAKTGAI